VNAEVCLPSHLFRKQGRVAGERATGGENFSAAGAGHWLFTPSHGSSAQNRRQKRDPTKDDKMFGFGFDSTKAVFQTRGWPEIRDMSHYLIENRIDEITHSFV
jgi:hypothetical protein